MGSKEKLKMKLLLSGARGLIGSALKTYLKKEGHQVFALVRSRKLLNDYSIYWNPARGKLSSSSLEGFDAIIHLAAENVGRGRWTEKKKIKIRDSRLRSTVLLSETLAQLKEKPKVFICASAIGFYGNRGQEIVNEKSAAGQGFLADVCVAWERASKAAKEANIRTVNLRIGLVLALTGGALSRMVGPFRLGLGGKIGSGRQYLSWIALDELVTIINFVLQQEEIEGAVNAVSPNPVTNLTFTKTLGKILKKPTVLPMPAFAAKALWGEKAKELLLSSTRVEPRKLIEHGYKFSQPNLEETLASLLN